MRAGAVFVFSCLLLVSGPASANCCRIIKVDSETPPVQVHVCEPDPAGACGNFLLLATLALGESETVCSAGETIIYEEYDEALADFGPPVEAVCEGDVQL